MPDWGNFPPKLGDEVSAEAFLDPAALGPLRTGAANGAPSAPAGKLDSAKTFENFVPAACNRAALQSAKDMADGRDCEPGVLVLHGPVGGGKTHLLVAVGNRVSQTHAALGPQRTGAPSGASSVPASKLDSAKTFENFASAACNKAALQSAKDMADGRDCETDRTVAYWRAPLFAAYLSAALRKGAAEGDAAVEELHRFLRSIDVLLFDDAHLIVQGPPKPRVQEELRSLIDAALEQGVRVVLTSKWHPNEFPRNSDEDLRARLASCLNVRLGLPGPDASLRILAQMAQRLWSGPPLGADVVECVLGEAASMRGWEPNCRQLEGALRTVLVAAKAKGRRKVTKKLVREALRSPVAPLRPISLEDVQAAVDSYQEFSVADMRSKRRTKALTRIRHMSMYLAWKLTNCSYVEIGKAWGNRHHTTVKSACDRIDRLVKTDRSVANECRELTIRIKAWANKPQPPLGPAA